MTSHSENGDKIKLKKQVNIVWLNKAQILKLYNSSKSNISEHINHVYKDGELYELSTLEKNFIVVKIVFLNK